MSARFAEITTGIRAPVVPTHRNYRFRPPRTSHTCTLRPSPRVTKTTRAMLHDAVSVTPRNVGGGKGLVVVSPIPKGTVVWWEDQQHEPMWVSIPRCRVYVESLPHDARAKFEHYMYKTGPDAYESLPEYDALPFNEWRLESDDPSMYMNHSCDPTCLFECESIKTDGVVVMTASRDLEPGDELTFDYATSEDHEQNWPCLCGAPMCRGRITGDDWKSKEFQQKYKGHCMPHVEDLIAVANGACDCLPIQTFVPPAFLTPEQVVSDLKKYQAAFWTKDECRAYAKDLSEKVPLQVNHSTTLGKHLVYAGDTDGEIEGLGLPILAGETVMLLPPNVLRRVSQIDGSNSAAAQYNASLQVRPSCHRPTSLFSLSETGTDLDNFLNHSCDPNCDVVVFPTNYAIALVANRDIFPNDSVTIDYDATEEDLVAQGGAFDCACGSEKCRGRVVGWKYRSPLINFDLKTHERASLMQSELVWTDGHVSDSVSDASENEHVTVAVAR